jgi:chromate reductase
LLRVLTVAGSLQRKSANRALLELIASRRPDAVEFVASLSLGEIPHYNPDLEEGPPPAVERWRKQLAGADAVVIASPEYGHGISGVLKNALDWLVRSGELNEKPVAATCAAQGKGRGLLGNAALVQTLRAIDARVVWNSPVEVPRSSIDENGRVDDPAVISALDELLATVIRSVG